MKKGLWALGACAVLAVGAIIVSSSIGAGGGKGPYRFHTGVFVRDQGAVGRVFVENLTNEPLTVKVKFSTESGAQQLAIPAGGQANVASQTCGASSCDMRVEVISKTHLIVPTLRWVDIDGVLHEDRGGDFIVIRDGKRLW